MQPKLDDVGEMISSAIASDPQVQSLLTGTPYVWMTVLTEERRNFNASLGYYQQEQLAILLVYPNFRRQNQYIL
ncbi:hypothetical protein Bca52824_003316 [Brassica carinata]|uniref:Uncharacterized protein n=1 Tax=Brassica carinata TaxID=52824 RepID=A0A8X7WMG7_BRACI|nr:hypothetical protein Bca52824_003316 [Brassica carinata]